MHLMSRMLLPYFLGLLTFLPVISSLTVILGHTATIPCTHNCSKVEWYRKEDLVCSFAGGNFTVAPEFNNRIKFSEAYLRQGNVSLTITNTVYNDRSWYVCSCDGKKGCDNYLDILVSTSLTIAVGDKANLPCYAETDKRTAESNANIQWRKDDKLVVELSHGETKYGAGFENRVSVSKEDYNRGDLSLTIFDVRPSDAGLYRCFAPNEKSKHPEVIHLTIKDSQPCLNPKICSSVICGIIFAVILGVLLWIYRRTLFTARCCAN